MGLFHIFKRKSKFVDDLFGELGYTTFRDKSKNFYDGTISFDFQQCGINLDADENGPTGEQKEFYKELCVKYPVLKKDVIIPFLNRELEGWSDKNPIITDFEKELELDGISLPVIDGKPVHWSLTLYSSKIKHYVTIDFTEWQPQTGVQVDG
ncbi:MAG: hypothetical protein V4722_01930 [Bacteroidota bacterium]